ncbi:hypothetical protein GGR53DRAFT_513510 [Hypoxylon sp. FL1150]|nr:hypothetical protein GGR53DRAFT_513510 [Hypoxylon sp. FL1150]
MLALITFAQAITSVIARVCVIYRHGYRPFLKPGLSYNIGNGRVAVTLNLSPSGRILAVAGRRKMVSILYNAATVPEKEFAITINTSFDTPHLHIDLGNYIFASRAGE